MNTYDIIHVASALKLKCRRFLSFDAKANTLARLAGLKTL
jgi:predicted nucleic acid-binding protein